MHAGLEELRPLVEGGEVALRVHDVELLGDAQPAGLGARLVGGSRRQELPLQLRHQPFIFELPHMAGQLGSDSGPWVAEVGSVVGIPQLPRGRRHADVALSPPPRCCDVGLVDHLVILAPGTDWTVLNTSSAVAVLVEGALGGQVVGDHLGVVAGYRGGEVGEGAVGELHCVPVEDSAEGVARGETSVQNGKGIYIYAKQTEH